LVFFYKKINKLKFFIIKYNEKMGYNDINNFLNVDLSHQKKILQNKKKIYFLFSKKFSLKIFRFFLITQYYQKFVIKISSFIFKPFFIKKNSGERKKNKKKIAKRFYQFKLEKKKNFFYRSEFYFQFLEFRKSINIKDRKIFFSLKHDLINNLFEETADTLQFFLSPDLIRFSISRNKNLAQCWLFNSHFNSKSLIFWFHYFFSCFDSMIKYKNSSEKKNFKEIFNPNKILSYSKKIDVEIFNIYSENLNENFNFSLTNFFSKNSISFLDKKIWELNLFLEGDFFFHWRNRKFAKFLSYKQTDKIWKKDNDFYFFLG
jgi:hypothetical protein